MMVAGAPASSSSEAGASTPPPHSLSVWLLLGATGCLCILAAAILGSSYTGLDGDWLTGNVVLGDEIYLATVGLTEVRLRNQRGTQAYALPQLCEQMGADSIWCQLDSIGADTEAMLTAAFFPALVVMLLSLVTMLQNCCVGESTGSGVLGSALQCFSTIYNGAMFFLWLTFSMLSTLGLCTFAFRAPATLGMGATAPSKSYGLVQAGVLYASVGSVALVARAFSLWDTRTVQMIVRELLQARFMKQWLYWMLCAQLLLFAIVSLTRLDYSFVLCLLGLNYLATKQVQMLWGYALLSLVTLPQDAVELAYFTQWATMDVVERISRVAFVLILLLKALILLGMIALHTKVRFRLRFLEITSEDDSAAAPKQPDDRSRSQGYSQLDP